MSGFEFRCPMDSMFEKDVAAVSSIGAVPVMLDIICRMTGMRFAAVARVTEGHWVACSVRDDISFGLKPGDELKVKTTICDEIRASGQAVVIDHVAEDASFCQHPTPLMYGFQSYISVPILRPSGEFFGTLCAIDPAPARVNAPEIIGMFKLFAELIGFHMDANDRLTCTAAALLDQRETAVLRDQFIAVLGHDLRNPLGAIDMATTVLKATPLTDRAMSMVAMIGRSTHRMAGLVDNVLDFARGRLGGGLPVSIGPQSGLESDLCHVVAELQSTYPDRSIESHIDLPETINCDRARIAQLLSNLLGNALVHGAADRPVGVRADTNGGVFRLSVTNGGAPIAEHERARLFQPFTRNAEPAANGGLGLGLYIVSEIARAHKGTVSVKSDVEHTSFTFEMPAT